MYNENDWRRESQPAPITSSARSHAFCGCRRRAYRHDGTHTTAATFDTGPPGARSGVAAGYGTMNEHFTNIGNRHGWGDDIPFGISAADQRHHLYLIGKTGSGKTTLLRNLIAQHIAAGLGLDFPIRFNPLANVQPDERHLVASSNTMCRRSTWRNSPPSGTKIWCLYDTSGKTENLSRIRMQTRDEQIEFIRLNGVRIAACAWNGYQAKGRGMVCVLSDLHNEVLRVVPFDFLPEIDAPKLFKPWAGSREARMVAGYDPTTNVVICFVRKDGEEKTDIDAYNIQTRPAPPLAAEHEE